ncbi:sigma factor-like helix-turn-helix DNA-binding protein [Heliophilum fasciatum]|uniref:sigma factor-like helix-turn-helix DNA-binding protein n=1 Tax=Heliophilum fasciatum TaxID=35700 RepID=UPI001FA95278|nr:sigma factor-like helix-turn-helix DNA-binding protein [Heliophilum fasciatum]MCW2279240.1 DNA-directed RNA polymerase specialized sigma subunit [Heliophilum fasciatum]
MDKDYGIYAMLIHLHHVRESRYTRGDYDASVLLLDLAQSIREAQLTRRQRQALYLVFLRDFTQRDAAHWLNISQQAVSDHVRTAIQRIAEVSEHKEVA